MATIATTTQTNPFEYPGQTLLSRHPNSTVNIYFCIVAATTANNYTFYKSTDGGATWTALQTAVRANIVDIGAIFQDAYGWVYWVYRVNESNLDKIYIDRLDGFVGQFVPATETLLGSAGNGGVAGAYYSGIDVKTYFNTANSYHYIAVAVGTNIGANQGVTVLVGLIDPAGNCTSANNLITGTSQWLHAGTAGRVGPSMDIEHTGDGYTGTPNLWIVYGRTHMKMVKIPWTGWGWNGSPGETTLYTNVGSLNQMCGRWDGSRFMMCAPDPVNTQQVMLFERNRANSSTIVRRTGNHTTGVVRSCVLAYDVTNGNVRVWAVGTSTAVLYQNDWARLASSWGGWGSTGLAAILGTNADNYGAKRSTNGDAKWGLYTAASGAPNTLTYTSISLSYSPNTPTWVSPKNGAAADVALSLPITWSFTDLDPGDSQSAYAVSRQIGSGSLTYWRASDNTWQVAEVQNTSGTTGITIPSAWALASDAVYTFKVKVWDQASNTSSYSAGLMVVPSTPVNPVITSPTAAQVLGTDHVTVVWTATEQTQYRVILNITTGAQLYDSGWIGDGASRSFLIPVTLATGGNFTITLQTANNEGLASALVTRQFTTNFTAPMTPTVVLLPIPATGVIQATITNPTPTGGAPAVASQDLYRRVVGDTSNGIRVGTGLSNAAVFSDWKAVSGVTYEYRVFTIGTTGVSVFGAWTQ